MAKYWSYHIIPLADGYMTYVDEVPSEAVQSNCYKTMEEALVAASNEIDRLKGPECLKENIN